MTTAAAVPVIEPAAELVGVFEPQSPEWYAARSGGLGGSEIAAVMGFSPWCSRFTLWHRKAGLVGEEADNKGMSWGRRLEDVIAEKFDEDHPDFRLEFTGTWRSVARPWQLANPDRLIRFPGDTTGVLEVKTAHAMDGWKWGKPGTDDIPVYYKSQCLWYMDVLGVSECYLIVLIGGSDDREYLIPYHAEDVQLLRDAGKEFLDSVTAGNRPPIDGSDNTYTTVRQLHPDIDSSTEKEIDPELASMYQSSCVRLDDAKHEKQMYAARLLDQMGTAQYAVCDGKRIAQRITKTGSQPFLRPTPNRRYAK